MKAKSAKQLVFVSSLVIAAVVSAGAFLRGRLVPDEYSERHVLTAPLPIFSNDALGAGVLPIGTRLVFDRAMPEGFDRYVVTVNVFGADLPRVEADRPNLVEPLSSYPNERGSGDQPDMTDEALVALLRSLGVRRADLERVGPQLE